MNLYFPPVRCTLPATALQIEEAFSAAELEQLERQCASVACEPGATTSGDRRVRECRVAWLRNDATFGWLFQRLHGLAHHVNAHYRFDLWGLAEAVQYTVYEDGGHFDWHVDDGVYGKLPRKLSITVQLSEAESYEGGDLEIWGELRHSATRTSGSLVAFPSYTLHRITPITRGLRRSLVAWITGPQFR